MEILESHDFEPRRAGAYAVGMDVQLHLGDTVAQRCVAAIDADNEDRQRLAPATHANVAENALLIAAFRDGLRRLGPTSDSSR